MKNFRSLFILIFILVGPTTWAGTEVGNGGDAVVCRNSSGKITSAELLDYYEARIKYGFTLKPAKTFDDNIRLLLGRLEQVNSYKVDEYNQQIAQFKNQALFISGSELVDIPESDHLFFPKGCKVEQLAIQVTPRFEYEKRYTINQDIWDNLDEANKAGLVIHEVFYRDRLGKTSVYVRNLNGLLMADRLKDLHPNIFKLAHLFGRFRDSTKVIQPEGTIEYVRSPNEWLVTNAKNFTMGTAILNGSSFRVFPNPQESSITQIIYKGNEKDGRTVIHIPRPKNFFANVNIPNSIQSVTIPEAPSRRTEPLEPQVVFNADGSIRALAGWRGFYPQPKMPEGKIECISLENPFVVAKDGTLELCEVEKNGTKYNFDLWIDLGHSFDATIRVQLDPARFKAPIFTPFKADGSVLWLPPLEKDLPPLLKSMNFRTADLFNCWPNTDLLCPSWQYELMRSNFDEGTNIKFRLNSREFDLPIARIWGVLADQQLGITFRTPQTLPVGSNSIEFKTAAVRNNRINGGILSKPYTEVINGKSTTFISELICTSTIFRPAKRDKIIYPIYFDEIGKVIQGHGASDTEDCYKDYL